MSLKARGRIRLWHGDQPGPWLKNTELYELAVVDAYLLRGGVHGGLYIYFEFENLAAPEDPPTLPTFDASGGMASGYYAGLASDPDKDFVRAAAYALPGDPSSVLYPESNVVKVFAQIRTTTGVHGKNFDEASNSKVYSSALALAREPGDWTQDLLLARINLATLEQELADVNRATGLEWEVTRELV
jgi:hypothetical protein